MSDSGGDERSTIYDEAMRASRATGKKRGTGNGEHAWKLTREKILFFFGLMLITAEWFAVVLFGKPFQFEWLLGGLACCGIAIAQWGDRSGRE